MLISWYFSEKACFKKPGLTAPLSSRIKFRVPVYYITGEKMPVKLLKVNSCRYTKMETSLNKRNKAW